MEIPGPNDVGALRLITVAINDSPSTDHPDNTNDGKYDESVVLDLDYTVLMPRRG